MPLNTVIVGVGGQGILTLARILASSSIARGVKALVSETHGMSQRGGSVIVHLRVGDDAHAPLIPEGEGHLLVGLELIEAARYSRYLKRDSVIVVNKRVIPPSIPDVELPTEEELLSYLESVGSHVTVLNASAEAERLGNPLGTNMYVLGYLAGMLSRAGLLNLDFCRQEVGKIGRGVVREANVKIFESGLEKGLQDHESLRAVCRVSRACRE